MLTVGQVLAGRSYTQELTGKGFPQQSEGTIQAETFEQGSVANKVREWSGSLVSKRSEGGDFKGTALKVGLAAGLTTIALGAMSGVAFAQEGGHDHGDHGGTTTNPPPQPPTNPPAGGSTHGHTPAEHAEYMANHDKLQWDTKEIIQHNFRGVYHDAHPITEENLHVVMRDGYEAWNGEADRLSQQYPDDVAHRDIHSELKGWHHDFSENIEHLKLGTYEVPRLWGGKYLLADHLKAFPGEFKVCWQEPVTKEVKIGEVPNDLNEMRGPFQMFPTDPHVQLNPDGTVKHVNLPTGVSNVTAINPVKNADGTVQMADKCATVGESNSVTQGKVDEFNRNLLIGIGVVVGIGVLGGVAYALIHKD
ncbi:MAG: hypothetical protein HYU64_15440 [Armatimonadetes bacterium]|nr:hypothetical protein [Armatimonadota bacterium]